MRTVIHLSEDEVKSFFKIVDLASDMAKVNGTKASEELAQYLQGSKNEEAFCFRFTSDL